MIADGWYLMNTRQLEELLALWRAGNEVLPGGIERLSVDRALAYRDAGNLPDSDGRSLRLVLRVETEEQLATLETRRAEFEPDHHAPPSWRREGSKPVNVVPLRRAEVKGNERPWWEDEEVAELERSWQADGKVAGISVPAEYRSFVYKTVLSLRRAGKDVTVESIGDSIARWLSPQDAAKVRAALRRDPARDT